MVAVTPWPLSLDFQIGLYYDIHSIFRSIFKSFYQVVYPVGVTTNRTCDFWKSHITLLFFIQSHEKLGCKCALILSYSPPNFKKIDLSTGKFCNFSKVCKKKIKNKNKMNFQGAHLHNGWMDSSQIWNGRHPLGNINSKNGLLLFRHGCVKMAFFWFLYNTLS